MSEQDLVLYSMYQEQLEVSFRSKSAINRKILWLFNIFTVSTASC